MTAPVLRVLGIAVAAATALAATAQDDGTRISPTFSSESELVVLHVAVFDRHGDAVPRLDQQYFHVIEDGAPQTITFFRGEDAPVAVGLVVDNSSSMLTRHNMVVAGIKAFSASSREQDEAFTIVFNENVRRGLPETVLFTHNPVLLATTLLAVPTGGKTALYDAVMAALDHLDKAEQQKHALVVLSDGEDNASTHSEEDMLTRAGRSNAIIYAVSTARLDVQGGNDRLLRRLARLTGGVAYRPMTEPEVVSAFAEIGGKIHQGYSLGYVPTNTLHDGSYRHVQVRVGVPGQRTPAVHVREGYVAPRHDHGR